MPIVNEEWDVPSTSALQGGRRHNFLTSNPTASQACERIAAALGGTLLVRTGDIDLEALREAGVLPEKIAYSVDVTDFYRSVANNSDGTQKKPGNGMGMPTWAELDEWYEDCGAVYNRVNSRVDQPKKQPEKHPETGLEVLKDLWGLTLKSTAIVAGKLANEGKTALKEKWAQARRPS